MTRYAFSSTDVAPFHVSSEGVPTTARTPVGRLEQAAREALPTILATHARVVEQEGVAPIIVVCAVDSRIGRRLVETSLGPSVAYAVCGPVVLTATKETLIKLAGKDAPKLTEKLSALAGDITVAFAVNASNLDLFGLSIEGEPDA